MLDHPSIQAMKTGIWRDRVVASGDDRAVVENNLDVPTALFRGHLRPSHHTSSCPWKGTA